MKVKDHLFEQPNALQQHHLALQSKGKSREASRVLGDFTRKILKTSEKPNEHQ